MVASLLMLLIFISANGFFRALGAKVDRVLTGITVIVMDNTVSMTFARDIRDRRQMSCIRLQHATGACTCTAPLRRAGEG